jgi:hypothetical protein
MHRVPAEPDRRACEYHGPWRIHRSESTPFEVHHEEHGLICGAYTLLEARSLITDSGGRLWAPRVAVGGPGRRAADWERSTALRQLCEAADAADAQELQRRQL